MLARPLQQAAALLTGSTASIAFEIAGQLAEAGVPKIMLNGRDRERAEAAVRALKARVPGVDARAVAADVCKWPDARRLAEETMAAFGQIDILVTSIGGVSTPQPFHVLPVEDFAPIIEANFTSVLYTCRAVMPAMMAQQGGVIINIASDGAKVPTPLETVVGSANAATMMFSRTLALEASRNGIRVHCLCPSVIEGTGSLARVMKGETSSKLFEKAFRKARLGVPTAKDFGPLVIYLASPDAARITGQTISINGGISVA